MNRADQFAAYVTARDGLQRQLDLASAALKAIPGIGSGPMGLTPDHIRAGADYQNARRAYDTAHSRLARLNGANVKRFAPELRQEREARRAAMVMAREGEAMA